MVSILDLGLQVLVEVLVELVLLWGLASLEWVLMKLILFIYGVWILRLEGWRHHLVSPFLPSSVQFLHKLVSIDF